MHKLLLTSALLLAACSSTGASTTSRRAVGAHPAEKPSASAAAPDTAAEPEAPDASAGAEQAALAEVTFEPVEPAPAPAKMPSVAILFPRKGMVISKAAAQDQEVKLDLKGWELKDGNHVRLVLDNQPSFRVDELKRPIKLRDLGSGLGEGQHFVAALLARANLETVKPSGRSVPAAVVTFFIGKKTAPVWKEGSPILVYSSPQSGPAPEEGLLVDFYVLNVGLAQGKTVLHAAVSGPGLRVGESISRWTPWRVRNPRPGLYAIQLSLYRFEADDFESESVTTVKFNSKPVPGPWSTVTREFTIRPD